MVESNFPLVTSNQRHYPDLGSEALAVNGISALFLRLRLAWKQVAASPNVGCCVRLLLHNFFRKNFVTKTLCRQVSFILTITRSPHVPLNSSICQSEEGLNLFSPDPFSLFISCLHDDAYLSTIVIKEQIKKSVKLPNVCLDIIKPIDSIKHRRNLDQVKIHLKNHCQKLTTNVKENYTE